ncbi:MAG TPA: hypothetical protein VG345_12880, partial [Bryobacteraceae bacterium]|nr:hypothetical protein [Bryobacteraceae bacterium]
FFLQEMTILEHPENPGEWKVRTLRNTYAIPQVHVRDGDMQTRREIIAFHWERGRKEPAPYPHIHHGAFEQGFPISRKTHIPAGRVATEDVICFLIREMGVTARHRNWASILERNRELFIRFKTAE